MGIELMKPIGARVKIRLIAWEGQRRYAATSFVREPGVFMKSSKCAGNAILAAS